MSTIDENRRAGTAAWWRANHAPAGAIEGYAGWPSALPGGQLALHVSTAPAARYAISVYRLGWYGGSGGRLLGRFPARGASTGVPRSSDVADGRRIMSAGWPATDVVQIGPAWRTGQYVAVLELLDGPHEGTSSMVAFVVREHPRERAPILVQMPVTTVAAYNHWGGKSLYPSNSVGEDPAVSVTFDRPIPFWHDANLNARWPFVWDINLLRFLERENHEVAYTTDVDVHREPWSVTNRHLLMTSGHDEYWTREIRAAWDAAQAAGTNVACMGANTGYWQCRLEDDARTMVQYRSHSTDPIADPSLATVRFRDLRPPRPESDLFGVQYDGGLKGPKDPPRDYVVELTSDPWMSAFAVGDRVPDVVGYEWDAPAPGLDGVTVLLRHEDPVLSDAACVRFRAGNSTAFAAGSLQFVWALDDWGHPGSEDRRVQELTRRALAELLDR